MLLKTFGCEDNESYHKHVSDTVGIPYQWHIKGSLSLYPDLS